MSNSAIMLKTVFGQTVELYEVTGTTAEVWVTKKLGTETFTSLQTFHTSKLFNLDGSEFVASED